MPGTYTARYQYVEHRYANTVILTFAQIEDRWAGWRLAKVVRSALQNAASIASLLLTTEAVISQIPEKNGDAAMPGGGMGAGMY